MSIPRDDVFEAVVFALVVCQAVDLATFPADLVVKHGLACDVLAAIVQQMAAANPECAELLK